MKFLFFLICFFVLMVLPALAGTYIQSITQDYADKNNWISEKVAIEKGKMRIDINGPNLILGLLPGKKSLSSELPTESWTILFDQNTTQLDLILPSKNSVYELTGADFTRIKIFLAPWVAKMQKALNGDPEMDKLDQDKLQNGKNILAQYLDHPLAPEASGVAFNGFNCDKYVFRFQNKKLMDYWCLPATAIPIDPQDYQTSKSLINLLLNIGGDFITVLGFDPVKIQNLPYLNTFPICSISYDHQEKPKDCYRLLSVSKQSFSPETFNIPATYEKTDVLDFVGSFEKMTSTPGSESLTKGKEAEDAKKYSLAMKYFLKAVHQGNLGAQCCVGLLYENGFWVPRNYKKAMIWYQKAAAQGNGSGFYDVGLLYEHGLGVAQDYEEALKWFQKAADKGNYCAEADMAYLYDKGLGTTRNYQEAMRWYQKAVEDGDVSANTNVGLLYRNGEGVTQDYQEAAKWYHKAADTGDAGGEACLGLSYANGEGVTRDYQQALNWCKKAAEQGNSDAECEIGVLYMVGQGVTQDYPESVKWLLLSAHQGNLSAEVNIGLLYEHGLGVAKDDREAMMWYQKAADQGSKDGQKYLTTLKQK
jgi:TPR repeat protein